MWNDLDSVFRERSLPIRPNAGVWFCNLNGGVLTLRVGVARAHGCVRAFPIDECWQR